ncbi:unnamed protein product, partial [Allacma fusca]
YAREVLDTVPVPFVPYTSTMLKRTLSGLKRKISGNIY